MIERDPITQSESVGQDNDQANVKKSPREPKRNPIIGEGEFGSKEWDPIWQYAGKPKRSTSLNCELNKSGFFHLLEPAYDQYPRFDFV
ncbi:hypothetical protein Ciccas_000023 [Cichlidogyrus casuarinus]|uniref:Uncharacterized protein n=1 Tax=Cichlidogyrus casuarinus TaxID=1844966 RepID=A0ABD2QP80_9PLAT